MADSPDDDRREIHVRVSQEEYDALMRLKGDASFTAATVALARWEMSGEPMGDDIERCRKLIIEHGLELDKERHGRRPRP